MELANVITFQILFVTEQLQFCCIPRDELHIVDINHKAEAPAAMGSHCQRKSKENILRVLKRLTYLFGLR